MTAKIEGNELVIRLPMQQPPRPSASGKTLVVATTHGNKTSEVEINGQSVVIGVNAYIYKD
jgi:hypothetical protein